MAGHSLLYYIAIDFPAGDHPTMNELLGFNLKDQRERPINIPQQIGTKYHQFGIHLLNDENGSKMQSISHTHRDNPEKINIEVLQEWIKGSGKQPVTWKTLIGVLRDTELITLASDIEAIKS